MVYFLLGYIFCLSFGFLLWKRGSWLRKGLAYFLWALTVLLLFCICYYIWYYHRLLPKPVDRELFNGISYSREIRFEPRKMVIHVVEIDLNAKGLKFYVTPGKETRDRSSDYVSIS